MAIACPLQLVGVIEGVYYFNAQICSATSTQTLANDTRDHSIGVNCANILDPIFVPDTIPIPTTGGPGGAVALMSAATGPRDYCCGCVHTGLNRYTTLNSSVMLAPGFDITAEYVVRYADQNDDGHHMERLARLFVLKGGPWKKKPVRIGQELAPGTKISGPLDGELKQPFGHHQCVATDKGVFNVVTKNYLQPVPRANGKRRRGARGHR